MIRRAEEDALDGLADELDEGAHVLLRHMVLGLVRPHRRGVCRTRLVLRVAHEAGHALHTLNIGGGFPAYYGEEIEGPTPYARKVMELVYARFGDVAHVMAEPGRGLVAEAGMIAAEVLLVRSW